jgi:hypothetical protein
VDIGYAAVHNTDSESDDDEDFVAMKASTSSSMPSLWAASDTDTDSDDDLYVVYELLDVLVTFDGQRMFLVWWLGYDMSDSTWEPEHALCHLDVYFEFCYRKSLVPNTKKKVPIFVPVYA